MVANIAFGDSPADSVPEASTEEIYLFQKTRRHLPRAVFDEAKWQSAVGPSWKRVVYVLNRGGRFEGADQAYAGSFVKHTWGKLLDLYVEPVGTTIHSITEKKFSGVPVYQQMQHMNGRGGRFSGGLRPRTFYLQRDLGRAVADGGQLCRAIGTDAGNFRVPQLG